MSQIHHLLEKNDINPNSNLKSAKYVFFFIVKPLVLLRIIMELLWNREEMEMEIGAYLIDVQYNVFAYVQDSFWAITVTTIIFE